MLHVFTRPRDCDSSLPTYVLHEQTADCGGQRDSKIAVGVDPRSGAGSKIPEGTNLHFYKLGAFLEGIYFRTYKRYVRSSSTLINPAPITMTAHRAEQISSPFAMHASEVRPGFSVTPSTSPFQSRQCSTLVPVLVSHGMAANFDTTLLMRYLADRFFLFVRSLLLGIGDSFLFPFLASKPDDFPCFPQTTLAHAR
ncbi:hypothetical protein F5144DRAFT_308078 [Chaetomium tenue]|uniref:Uncharacterized protein n=1 Tax=Chaetomium tenue TaxID=1854479 RepID=A0ACB7P8X9_9PEZI|nr:hypothetical protein F5144DRAFT_308078 [Chaetomium globosum]